MKLSTNLNDCPIVTEELIGRFVVLAILNLLFGASAPRPGLKPPVPREQLDKMIKAAASGEEVEVGIRVVVSADALREAQATLMGIA